MKIVALAFAASLVLTISLLLAYDNSSAAAWCNPGRSDNGLTYEAGWGRNPGLDVGGVYSYMFNYPTPYVAVGRNTVQVVSLENTGIPSVYARLGWIQYSSPWNRFTVAQWKYSSGSNAAQQLLTAEPVNNFSYYKLTHNRQNPGKLTFEWGPSLSQLNKYTVSNATAWVPNRGETQGMTNSLANQMPGGYQTQSIFGDTHIWYSGGWQAFNGALFITNPSYHYAIKQSIHQLDIQDWYCP